MLTDKRPLGSKVINIDPIDRYDWQADSVTSDDNITRTMLFFKGDEFVIERLRLANGETAYFAYPNIYETAIGFLTEDLQTAINQVEAWPDDEEFKLMLESQPTQEEHSRNILENWKLDDKGNLIRRGKEK